MKKKKRYILLRSDNYESIENTPDLKIISNKDDKIIVMCQLERLSQIISQLQKHCKIITVSGTLKSIRSSV